MSGRNAKAPQNGAESLTSDDHRLITELLSNATVRAGAKAAGVSEATVYRRLQDEAFASELARARLRCYAHAIDRIQALAGDAVGALESVLNDPEAPPASRIRAAAVVLERADALASPPVNSPAGRRVLAGEEPYSLPPGLEDML